MGCGKSSDSGNNASSAGEITLHYFDIYGRAEVLRMIFHYHGVAFTDHRVQQDQWPALLGTGIAEFDSLPVLEIDGHKLVETRAIARYLCRKFGYYPSDYTSAYWVESVCELKDDALTALIGAAFKKDMEGLQQLYMESIPFWLSKMEARLKRNGNGDGWFVGNTVSLADFEVFSFVWDWCLRPEVKAKGEALVIQHAPKVKAFVQRFIGSSSKLQAYLDYRQPRPL